MIPNSYVCDQCREEFRFDFRQALYYFGNASPNLRIADEDLFVIPVRPAWCKRCECICIAEDIAPLRFFEDAYGAARKGLPLEYPVVTEYVDAVEAAKLVEPYLRWRMARRHAPRALCCGSTNFQLLDVATPLIKHAECEFGFIEPQGLIGPYCGPGPGVRSAANIRLYNTEGELIGRITWFNQENSIWDVEPVSYSPDIDDQGT